MDQIARFLEMHNMTVRDDYLMWRNAILHQACESPGVPLLHKRSTVTIRAEIQVPSGWTKVLLILEGDSPSQMIYSFASETAWERSNRRVDEISLCTTAGTGPVQSCEDAAARHKTVVLRQPIQIDDRKLTKISLSMTTVMSQLTLLMRMSLGTTFLTHCATK